jgi:hypothetical protein
MNSISFLSRNLSDVCLPSQIRSWTCQIGISIQGTFELCLLQVELESSPRPQVEAGFFIHPSGVGCNAPVLDECQRSPEQLHSPAFFSGLASREMGGTSTLQLLSLIPLEFIAVRLSWHDDYLGTRLI